MIQTNWYVITGAPSSGKTTLINELAKQGYLIAPEIARAYIEQLLTSKHSMEEIQLHNTQLQRGILALALKRERHFNPQQLIFFDRGTPDSIGYFNYHLLPTNRINHACTRLQYKKIFYCHPLPIVQDDIRVEDNKGAKTIGLLIYKAYKELNYDLIELPPIPVEERLSLILAHLKQELPVSQ
jgi:predicted ATPase